MIENTNLYTAKWAENMAHDCKAAQHSIHLTAISCLPPTEKAAGAWKELFSSWEDAAKRGVEVHIWLPVPNKAFPATLQNHTAGMKLSASGVFTHMVKGNRLLHAKTCIIDNRIAWVGSGNFTAAAANYNYEAYLRVDCAKIALDLRTRWELLA